jgi:hypothetical protein
MATIAESTGSSTVARYGRLVRNHLAAIALLASTSE